MIPVAPAVFRFVDFPGFGIADTLVSEGCIALLLTDDILTGVSVFLGGHDPV